MRRDRRHVPPLWIDLDSIHFGAGSTQIGEMRRYAAAMSEQGPIVFVCANCASPGITREAWASWNVAAQDWQLTELFDYSFCHSCHRRTRIDAQRAEESSPPASD